MKSLNLIIEEISKHPTRNIELLKPSEIDRILHNNFNASIKAKNDNLLKVFYVSWIFNFEVSYKILSILQLDDSELNEILNTDFFEDTGTHLKVSNICYTVLIKNYFLDNWTYLNKKFESLANTLLETSIPLISEIRLKFYIGNASLCESSETESALIKFARKSEYAYIFETKYYIYLSSLYLDNCNALLIIKYASDFIYEAINYNATEYYDIEKNLKKRLDSVGAYFYKLIEKEKDLYSQARVKYALFKYFEYKRSYDFKAALNELNLCYEYIEYCSNKILIAKVIRFKALCIKEIGNREYFLSFLKKSYEDYPENLYLCGTYYANYAASILHKNPSEAHSIIIKKVIPAVIEEDDYLYLWVLNDELIYDYYENKTRNDFDWYQRKANKNLILAEKLSSITDIARIYNFLGTIAFFYNIIDLGKSYLEKSFYTMMGHEENNILFYFITNFIQTFSHTDKLKYEWLIKYAFQWCIKNIDLIKSKIEDLSYDEQNNKLFTSICTFLRYLRKNNDTRYEELLQIFKINEDMISKENSFLLIRGRAMILF